MDKKTNRIDRVYTVTRDCYIFSWGYNEGDKEGELSDPPSPDTPERDNEGMILDGDARKKKRFCRKRW